MPKFGHALLKELGEPNSAVMQTIAEVRFKTADAWRRALAKDPAVQRVYALHPWNRSSESTVAATIYVRR